MKYIFLFITSFIFAQQTKYVDFKSVSGQLSLNSKEKTISGVVDFQFEVLKNCDTILLDAKNMDFSNVKINDKEVVIQNNNKQLKLISHFEIYLGKKVQQSTMTSKELNVSSLSPGVYIIKIKEGDATVTRKQIIK